MPKGEWRALGWEDIRWDRKEMWERLVLKIDFRVKGTPGYARRRRRFKKRAKEIGGGSSVGGFGY